MSDRLKNLRTEMKTRKLDGFFVPRADEFQGEYVPACAARLAWATGFTGSAGAAVILQDKAAFFTDGRYTLQAAEQVDAADFEIYTLSDNDTPAKWIEKNVKPGAVFGIDPWLHTPNAVRVLRDAVEKAGGTLVYAQSNPLDAAWENRPAAPATPAVSHPLEFSGVSSQDKRTTLAQALQGKANALALTLPEEICWLLNIRGDDVPCTPFCLSYALAHSDGTVDWFVDAAKVTQDIRDFLGEDVRIHKLEDYAAALDEMAQDGKVLWVDPASAPVIVADTAGEKAVLARSPVQLMKAKKNKVEIDGSINAHIRDGVAMVKFLAKLSEQGAAARFDELSASGLLEDIRAKGERFKGLSFDTISGSGGHGAIVHYKSSQDSNQSLTAGPVYLVDSGAQYLDGTTDITRTLAVDTPTPEMRENFTRVLKGHIAVATAVFPAGTTGSTLDTLARAPLKEVGLDYAHGTGHGVGSYLSVHEGPCGISEKSTTVALEAGMIISNEPGYYKTGEYGIRIENLVLVTDTGEKDASGRNLLAFQTLTLAPIDRNMIEPSLLNDDELRWLNDYHTRVRATLLPLLDKADIATQNYLTTATAEIKKPGAPSAKARKNNSFLL